MMDKEFTKISDMYSISFEGMIKVVIIPADGVSQEEAEVAFAKDMRGLGDAGLVEISKADDGRIALDFGREKGGKRDD